MCDSDTRTSPPPLTPASPADTTLSSWFLEKEEKTRGNGAAGTAPPRSLSLIILNHDLPPVTPALFARAGRARVVAADGGANRLYEAAPGWAPHLSPADARAAFAPAVIVGDLDSLSPAVASFYAGAGVPVLDCSADQDSTDLEKAVTYVRKKEGVGGGDGGVLIVAAGALGGRLDHSLAALNALFSGCCGRDGGGAAASAAAACDLVLLGDGNLARALPAAGTVAIEPAHGVEGPACGLVALGGVVAGVRTAGLAWELSDASPSLAWGGLQSTSNAVVGVGQGGRPRVVVEVGAGGGGGGRLLWVSECR